MKNTLKKFFFLTLVAIFLSSCSPKKNNNDLDLSSLKRSKKINLTSNVNSNNILPEKNLNFKDLVPLKDKQEILSKFEYGKLDPFSQEKNQVNNLNIDFKLSGFLNTQNKRYVFVSYQNNTGTITEGSIGGLNTELLPPGAKIMSIDPQKNKLIINFENKNFIFEL